MGCWVAGVTHTTTIAARVSIHSIAKTLRRRVLLYIFERGSDGATLEEMEIALAMPGNTVRPRRQELEKKGLVVDSGRTRPTTSGRSAVVWVIPPAVAKSIESRLKHAGLI